MLLPPFGSGGEVQSLAEEGGPNFDEGTDTLCIMHIILLRIPLVPPPFLLASIGERLRATQREERIRGRKGGCVSRGRGRDLNKTTAIK